MSLLSPLLIGSVFERFNLQSPGQRKLRTGDLAASHLFLGQPIRSGGIRCRRLSKQSAISLSKGKRISLAKLLNATGNLVLPWNSGMGEKGWRGVWKMPVTTYDISPKR